MTNWADWGGCYPPRPNCLIPLFLLKSSLICNSHITHTPCTQYGRIYQVKNFRFSINIWHEIFVGVYFCGLAIFCVLRELNLWLGQIGFSCWELFFFAIFAKYPVLSIDNIFVFNGTFNRNTYFQTINQYFIVYCFASEWKRQVVIEQTRFLSAGKTMQLCNNPKRQASEGKCCLLLFHYCHFTL